VSGDEHRLHATTSHQVAIARSPGTSEVRAVECEPAGSCCTRQRIHVRFTPISGSWLNLVEVWFGIIERQAIHRGTFRSVRDLMLKIRQSKAGTNRKHPFIWTKTAEDILGQNQP
jgi:hypothetical protein